MSLRQKKTYINLLGSSGWARTAELVMPALTGARFLMLGVVSIMVRKVSTPMKSPKLPADMESARNIPAKRAMRSENSILGENWQILEWLLHLFLKRHSI